MEWHSSNSTSKIRAVRIVLRMTDFQLFGDENFGKGNNLHVCESLILNDDNEESLSLLLVAIQMVVVDLR